MIAKKIFRGLIILALIPAFIVAFMSATSFLFGIAWGNVIGGLALSITGFAFFVSPFLFMVGVLGCFCARRREKKKNA